MFRNYLKVAVRTFLKYKEYTIINLFGLSVGICCSILIMLYVRSEFSYDKFHGKADRLYRAWTTEKENGGEIRVSTRTSLPLAQALQRNVHEIEQSCRVYKTNLLVRYENYSFNEPVHLVDTQFFRMFDFKLKEGNVQQPWPNSHSLIISETIAKKYFPGNNVTGKNLELQFGDNKVLFTSRRVCKMNCVRI